jgi:hypothetical protein
MRHYIMKMWRYMRRYTRKDWKIFIYVDSIVIIVIIVVLCAAVSFISNKFIGLPFLLQFIVYTIVGIISYHVGTNLGIRIANHIIRKRKAK